MTANYTIRTIEETETQGKFVFEPLQYRSGRPLGNALRRVLLSSVPGAAICSLQVDGIYHEFTGIEGVVEDASTIILNLKQLILDIDIQDNDVYTLRINKKGPYNVYARDIECPTGVGILNGDLYICTIAEGGSLNATMQARLGRGYVGTEANKHLYQSEGQPLGMIYTDSLYSPIKNVNYEVQEISDKGNNADSLTIGITTNGTIKPSEALSIASKILKDHLEILTKVDEETLDRLDQIDHLEDDGANIVESRHIDELDLSVRSKNSLRRAGVHTIEELTQKTEEELAHIRNFGKISLDEVKEKMKELGLSFKSSND